MVRPKFIYPARPDFDEARAKAGAEVTAELGKLARPDDRARRAGEIVAAADEVIAEHQSKRDAAALSLWAYEGHRTRGLELSMGITRPTFNKIQWAALDTTRPPEPGPERIAAARAAGIEELDVDQALTDLPQHGMQVEQARARRAVAVDFRNTAIMALIEEPYSMDYPDIAALASIDSVITVGTIVKRIRDAAAKQQQV
ncbi:hypothetical protein [Kitasatospora sp. NPDC088548]|uniref:hypothetical protein n=1 Tax=Kitasatospora sp. NPDC088548 TaxID=3364075 RepID=UPI003802A357